MLSSLNNNYTDKNTTHSYLDLYESLLSGKKDTAKNVLEVGINTGGSIKLWRDYFTTATVYGIDISKRDKVIKDILDDPRVILYNSTNGYDPVFVRDVLGAHKFDFMLDDGPHTLQSMIDFITLYSPLMTEDGILIVEDVQKFEWIETLRNATPEDLKPYIKVYDLRANKGRYDDIVFTIEKS